MGYAYNDFTEGKFIGNSFIAIGIAILVLAVLMPIVVLIFSFKEVKDCLKSPNPWLLIVQSIVMICTVGTASMFISGWRYGSLDFSRWFNGLLPAAAGDTVVMILVGMVGFIVFGFLDNAGLFFGSNYLDDIFQDLPGAQDANVFAGYGNTYSDTVGAFLGTFVGLIINDLTEFDSSPLWCQAVGIVIGCLIGILVPKLILGNSSDQHGINRAVAMSNLIGSAPEDELKMMLTSYKSQFEYTCEKLFKKIDIDNSGTHEPEEVRAYMVEAGCKREDIDDFIAKNYNGKKVGLEEFKGIFKGLLEIKKNAFIVGLSVKSKIGYNIEDSAENKVDVTVKNE